MKSILRSLALIVAVAGFGAGTTHALFTGSVALAGNFTTGTIQITPAEGSTTNLAFTNLKPGDTMRKWFTITNTGTLPVGGIALDLENVVDTSGLLGQVDVSVIGFDNNPGGNAYFTPNWGTGGSPVTYYSTAHDVFTTPQWQSGTIPTVLNPGESDQFVLDFTVPSTMDNSWQGQVATFNLNFTATQTAGSFYFL